MHVFTLIWKSWLMVAKKKARKNVYQKNQLYVVRPNPKWMKNARDCHWKTIWVALVMHKSHGTSENKSRFLFWFLGSPARKTCHRWKFNAHDTLSDRVLYAFEMQYNHKWEMEILLRHFYCETNEWIMSSLIIISQNRRRHVCYFFVF